MKQILYRLLRPYLPHLHIKTLKRGERYEITVYKHYDAVLAVLNGCNLFEVVEHDGSTISNVIRLKTA